MNAKAKKRKLGRTASSKLSRTHLTRASKHTRLIGPGTTTDAIADNVRPADRGDVLLYQAQGGIALEVRVQGDTVWLTQPQMAKLFGRERSVVTKHVNNVFTEGELESGRG